MLIPKVDPALSQLGPAMELFTPGCSSTHNTLQVLQRTLFGTASLNAVPECNG
jgi:hypothetical protein